jgi:hypothetical protein
VSPAFDERYNPGWSSRNQGPAVIDTDLVDAIFDTGQQTGRKFVWGICDKTFLLPLPQLPGAVKGETGEDVDELDLRMLAQAGWFSLLRNDDVVAGVPLYIPSRIGEFMKLRRAGYSSVELALFARFEEQIIEYVLAADDLAYLNDDLDLLIRSSQLFLQAVEDSVLRDAAGNPVDRSAEINEARKHLPFFQRLKRDGIPVALRPKIARHAFRVRAFEDVTRVMMLNQDRSCWKAGYSPWVAFRNKGWNMEEGFKAGEIIWDITVRQGLAFDLPEGVPTRLPGFDLLDGEVRVTRTMQPSEYEAQWRHFKLDDYLHALASAKGSPRCLNCLKPLKAGPTQKKKFCGERCRNIAKQRRFRERNPEAAAAIRRRYIESLDE